MREPQPRRGLPVPSSRPISTRKSTAIDLAASRPSFAAGNQEQRAGLANLRGISAPIRGVRPVSHAGEARRSGALAGIRPLRRRHSRAPVLITSPPPFFSGRMAADLAHNGEPSVDCSEIAEKHSFWSRELGTLGGPPSHLPVAPFTPGAVRCGVSDLFPCLLAGPHFSFLPVPYFLGRGSPSGPSAVGIHPGNKKTARASTLDGGAERA